MPRKRTILRDLRDDLKVQARFWAKVETGPADACWPWMACRFHTGYGKLALDGKAVFANRVAWVLTHGPIPESLDVLHRCDNPPCCNPAHLFLGTHADNMRDRSEKGRRTSTVGEQNPKCRLTEQDVLDIRASRRNGNHNVTAVAAQYGITVSNYWAIVHYRSWKHLP
jgi:hypothetical protein